MNHLFRTASLLLLAMSAQLSAQPLFQTDFQSAAVGSEPDGFLIIDGQFSVQEFEGDKVFELPGSPLESFGFLFGPNIAFAEGRDRFKVSAPSGDTNEPTGVMVAARAFGTKQGRRYPAYSVGLCGVSGYKLRVAPMKRALELVRGDETVASVEQSHASGVWLRLKLQVRSADGKWIAEGKVWKDGDPEPAGWQIEHVSNDHPNPGKASCWAAPFSGHPIRFDDLTVEAINE